MNKAVREEPEVLEPGSDQPNDVRTLALDARDALIVSVVKIDGVWQVLSRYADPVWMTTGATSNRRVSQTFLDFNTVPEPLRASMKEVMYRYIRRGRGSVRPKAGTQRKLLYNATLFLTYLCRIGIVKLSKVTSLACAAYAHESSHASGKKTGRRLTPGAVELKLRAVEALYELSQFCSDRMPEHPWPETSSLQLSGLTGANKPSSNPAKTPLMPHEVFVGLFQRATGLIHDADRILSLRDITERVAAESIGVPKTTIVGRKNAALELHGWSSGVSGLRAALMEIRTACYVVIASVSGCRNHELSNLKAGCIHSTVGDDGERYFWMSALSEKTYEGVTEWMLPEAGVAAVRVMERWSVPLLARLQHEIEQRRAMNPLDPGIAEAQKHLGTLFVGESARKGGEVRTVSGATWNTVLKGFARDSGLTWELASHQFRRKFANYAARSQFGDLRYLKEHFKHWSMDMTLGYAMSESQEMSLYLEILEELDGLKIEVAETWLDSNEPLAGGYGKKLVEWRSREEPITLFKSHKQMVEAIATSTAIRSNGHAWCTADDDLCVGNDLEPTRCSGCSGAAIGRSHTKIYQQMYGDLEKLRDSEDIGEGGRSRVRRDLDRCRSVLTVLGHEPQEAALL